MLTNRQAGRRFFRNFAIDGGYNISMETERIPVRVRMSLTRRNAQALVSDSSYVFARATKTVGLADLLVCCFGLPHLCL